MKKFNYLSLIIILILFFTAPNNLFANYKGNEKDKGKKPILQKTSSNPSQSLMNINNATMWVTNEGFHDWVVASSWNGAFPNGASVGAIFAEGVVWGGKVSDGKSPSVRVNGNTYGTGCSPVTRLYRVRADYETGDLTSDAATFNDKPVGSVSSSDIEAIRAQYATDWEEWPARADAPEGDQGAPYEDVDGDGKYDPAVDIPGIPGASQTIFIKYNDDLSEALYGSIPIGLEISETYWAYAYSGALGNVIYKKMDMVYTGTENSASNSKIDSMYIVQWADPDVGSSSDDYAGCDTTLDLGYAYNSSSSDGTYSGLGLAPPAVGYDFLQGVSQYTGNPNDSAVYDLQWRKGYKYVNSRMMSSFAYFAAGGTWEDPDFEYRGTLQFYNLMRGYLPEPPYPSATPFPDAVVDYTSGGTFLVAGDPVAGTGKLDGNYESASDRRIMVTNGPITMTLGDTAQIVLALVYGLGSDNLSSVTALKKNDETAQIVFDQLFQLPSIDPPKTNLVNLDKKIVLNWGWDVPYTEELETFSDKNYTFEGYEIYQLPSSSATREDGKLLATYDVVNDIQAIYDTSIENGVNIPELSANGTDKGLKRYYTIDYDQFREQALRNGQEYYFAVISYAFNPSPLLPFHVLRSKTVLLTGVPQETTPGVRYSSNVGDTLEVVHSGGSDGYVEAIVVDPSVTTGDEYKVTFASDGTWTLTDVTTGEVKLADQVNQSGDEDYFVIDGLLMRVVGPEVAINSWSFTPSSDRWFTGVNWGGAMLGGGLDLGVNFFDSNITPDQYVTVEIRFVTDKSNGQRAYRYLRGGSPSYGYQDYEPQYFTVWDVDNNQQISAAYVEQNGSVAANSTWEPTETNTDREYLFILNTPYSETPDAYYTTRNASANSDEFPTLYALWPLLRTGYTFDPQDGQVFKIIPNYANTVNDEFTFTAPAASSSNSDVAKADVEKINVFPNPYYGYQYRETSPTNKYVTFSHLPDNAVIRIFDLSGVLVKTIHHVSTSGQFDTWNLQNDNNYPVASGVYIVYIDMPGIGTTKVLKLAVIQEQQMLKVY